MPFQENRPTEPLTYHSLTPTQAREDARYLRFILKVLGRDNDFKVETTDKERWVKVHDNCLRDCPPINVATDAIPSDQPRSTDPLYQDPPRS